MPTRRSLLALAASTLAAPALAQGRFPERPVRVICPWPAGGTTDLQMRALCEAAAKELGQPVVVENRPGASGTLGAVALKQAPPDGYLLSQMPISVFRFPFMTDRPAWDPLRDFTWIAHITGYLFGIVVRADSPFRTLADMIAWAKANPGRLTYGTPGAGTSLHITMEQLAQAAGVEFLHVPFRGWADNSAALLAGTVMVSADSSGWAPLVQEGRLRLLATWGAQRAKRFPEVPTLREQGYDIVSISPYGIAGPAGMDPAVVRILERAFLAAMDEPAHRAMLERFDMEPMPLGHADYTAEVARMVEREGAMVRRLGLRL